MSLAPYNITLHYILKVIFSAEIISSTIIFDKYFNFSSFCEKVQLNKVLPSCVY